MSGFFTRTGAKLAASLAFCIFLPVLGAALGGLGAALAAFNASALGVLIVVALAGIVANRFAFATLESDLAFVLSVGVGAAGLPLSAGFVAIPGAFAGMLVSLVLLGIMDRPNVAAAVAAAEVRRATRGAEQGVAADSGGHDGFSEGGAAPDPRCG
jgi:hypothetical protein